METEQYLKDRDPVFYEIYLKSDDEDKRLIKNAVNQTLGFAYWKLSSAIQSFIKELKTALRYGN